MIWILWVVFLVALFVIPFGYGYGYRGWGTPRPTYFRRRPDGVTEEVREIRTDGAPVGSGGAYDAGGWGWWADVLWIVGLVLVVWFVLALIF